MNLEIDYTCDVLFLSHVYKEMPLLLFLTEKDIYRDHEGQGTPETSWPWTSLQHWTRRDDNGAQELTKTFFF